MNQRCRDGFRWMRPEALADGSADDETRFADCRDAVTPYNADNNRPDRIGKIGESEQVYGPA